MDINPRLALEFLDKQNPKNFLLLSQCFFKAREFSIQYFLQKIILAHFLVKSMVFLNAGWISIEMNDFDGAIDFFDMAIGIDALCSEALYGKGSALKKKGEDFSSCQIILSNIDKELII